MDREQLEDWLEQGLSLAQIAALVDRHPSTVGYWCREHGLVPNGRSKYASKGPLQRAQLGRLVDSGATVDQLAEALDRSPSTIRYWLGRYRISLAGAHRHRELADEAIRRGQRRFIGTCRRHGRSEFLVFASGRHRCSKCNSQAVARRRRRMKAMLVAEAGGRCVSCGFDRHPSALHFHHLVPADKEFPVSNRGATVALARARVEASKCVLLCANCHALVEAGVIDLSGLSTVS